MSILNRMKNIICAHRQLCLLIASFLLGIVILFWLFMPKKVKTEQAEYMNFPFSYEEMVTINPDKLTVIKPNFTAKIATYLVKPGVLVHEGQPLAEVDIDMLHKQIEQLQEGLAKGRMSKATPQHSVGGGNDKNRALLDAGIITQKEYTRLASQSMATVTNENGTTSNYTFEAMRVQLQRLQEIEANPRILATANGRLSTFYNQEQKLAIEDRPFAMIQQISPLIGTAILPIAVSTQNLKVTIVDKGESLQGQILAVSPIHMNEGQQTLVKVQFVNDKNILVPGQAYKMHFTAPESYHVLTVPTEAIHTLNEEHFVYILDENNLVDIKNVAIGQTVQNRTIILHGLAQGDEVIISKGNFDIGEEVRK